ncbi:MAG: FKBP-type peptidyl-prolyl cis-trans isomerase, partial [bacterium]
GMQLGKSVKGLSEHVDLNIVIQAMTDVYEGKELKLTEDEAKQIRMAFSKQMQAEQTKKVEAEKLANLQEGQKYLAENGKRNEVTTTASGLQYEVVKNGNGEKPVDGDRVKVHYRGTLIDGTEFDSSYSRGEPVEFPLNGVIKGWTEALKLMSVGSKYKLYIPSELAYGERGTRGPIGPNATLLFEVELLDIIKPETKKPE